MKLNGKTMKNYVKLCEILHTAEDFCICFKKNYKKI